MRESSDIENPDAELKDLVSRFLEGRLDPKDRERLEQRLRDEPDAREYCARELRFDARLQEVVSPHQVEWLETRRVVMANKDGGPAWELHRNQSMHYGAIGSPALSGPPLPRRMWRWWAAGLGLCLAAAGVTLLMRKGDERKGNAPVPLSLRNADFEATDLSYIPSASNSALLDWQDYFTTSNADLCEIGRVSNGKIFAKSGRNVARLRNFGFLTQRLTRPNGGTVRARPGMRLKVTGWANVMDGTAPYALRGSLRFVAGGSPGMIQYEAVNQLATFQKGDWESFSLEFTLPSNLEAAPRFFDAGVGSPAKLDLTGKELTLVLDGHINQGVLLLDSLKIEELPDITSD